MTFNKFWVFLVFVLLYFLFLKNIVLCAELANLSHDLKKMYGVVWYGMYVCMDVCMHA